MFFIILDENPIKAAQVLPKGIKFKQLLEVGQLVCSAGYSKVFKPLRSGKEIQEWIKINPAWTQQFMKQLLEDSVGLVNMTNNTFLKLNFILNSLPQTTRPAKAETAVFRYSKDYSHTHKSNTKLPIGEAVACYKEYVEWKKQNKVKGYIGE